MGAFSALLPKAAGKMIVHEGNRGLLGTLLMNLGHFSPTLKSKPDHHP
jgi:hypothetical protein